MMQETQNLLVVFSQAKARALFNNLEAGPTGVQIKSLAFLRLRSELPESMAA